MLHIGAKHEAEIGGENGPQTQLLGALMETNSTAREHVIISRYFVRTYK